MATLGYVRSSNGPDLAQVGVNEQLVSHTFPNTTAETLRITHISAWVGNWGGTATMRFGIWAASSSSAAPGALLARTVEFSPTTSYVDGAGGQLRTVALETPYELAPGQVIALGVASRNNSAGIAMYQAADISRPNENFYRKGISGTNLQSASGSSVSNEGHLAIYVTGTTNDPPYAPDLIRPGLGQLDSTTPLFTIRHSDPNGDRTSKIQIRVQPADGSATLWNHTWNASIASGSTANRRYDGSALLYYTQYRWQSRVWDSHGEEGPWSAWQNFSLVHDNHNPNDPSDPTGLGTRNSRSITASFKMSDPDYPTLPNGQEWEIVVSKQVRVRRVSDNVLVYNPGIIGTTTAERNAMRTSTSFTLPQWDVWYRWEERHRDRSLVWSGWTHTNVIARSGASVDAPLSPSGRITDPDNPGIISAVYRNTAPLNARDWRVVLRYAGGGIIATSPILSPAGGVPPDTQMNMAWATTGFTLDDGVEYELRAQVRDPSSGRWIPWSDPTFFTTNAPPNKPTLHGPNSDARSVVPNLNVRGSDPDQPFDEITMTVEIYDDTDTLIGTLDAPLRYDHSINNLWSTDLAATRAIIDEHGTYRWRAQANDGFLDSPWSDMFTLNYFPVPDVSVTAPTGPVISTSQPLFQWSSTGQVAWRVVGRDDNDVIVYDTGERFGSAQQHAIAAAQYWRNGERWNNYESFTWTVMVQDSSTLWGSSDPLTLTLEYIPPDPLIIESVEAMSFTGVKGTHYAVIATSQPEVNEEDFIRIIGDRVEIDGPAGNEIPGTLISAHFDEGNSAATVFADFDMTSNQWYRWAFRYEVQSGVDIISSEPVYAEAMISFHGTLLHMPFDPLGTYVWLPYGEQQYEPEVTWHQGHSEVMTVNGRAPHGYSDSTDYVEWRCTSTLVPREDATVEQQRDALRRLWKYQNARFAPNGRPNSVCFREGRGGDDGLVIGRMSEPVRRHSYTRLYTMEFVFRELEEIPVEGGGA